VAAGLSARARELHQAAGGEAGEGDWPGSASLDNTGALRVRVNVHRTLCSARPAIRQGRDVRNEDGHVEVKIGVQHAPREIVLESNDQPEDVEAAVTKALQTGDGLLSLTDERGRRVLIPAGRIAYIELGPQSERRVGFGAM
jgi:hypothetical protein